MYFFVVSPICRDLFFTCFKVCPSRDLENLPPVFLLTTPPSAVFLRFRPTRQLCNYELRLRMLLVLLLSSCTR